MTRRAQSSTTTGGSDEREARSMLGSLLRFDFGQEAARLRAESEYLEGDRNARTLVKVGAFRLVLVAFRAGALLNENDQRGSIALQALEGRVSLRVGQDVIEIAQGQVGVVPADHAWTAAAITDGLLLLYMSWPPEPGSVVT
jgi:quercetin dioxygenase-like cupin family protein